MKTELKKGNRYMIGSRNGEATKQAGTVKCMEAGYEFIYESRIGKHHVFREVKHGWVRTYTDMQLLGKKIYEVR